jgi:hypothetical protein
MPTPSPPNAIYQIRLAGHLDPTWADYFNGWQIRLTDDGETILTGPILDQANLYGLLRKLRDVGLPLIALNRLESITKSKATRQT